MSQMSSQLTAESKQYANRARDLARQVGCSICTGCAAY